MLRLLNWLMRLLPKKRLRIREYYDAYGDPYYCIEHTRLGLIWWDVNDPAVCPPTRKLEVAKDEFNKLVKGAELEGKYRVIEEKIL